MFVRATRLAPILPVLLASAACGVDGSLSSATGTPLPDGSMAIAEASVNSDSNGGGTDAPGTTVDSSLDTSIDTGVAQDAASHDADPVCDSGSSLGGPCVGASGCCAPLLCTTAMTCQWSCSQNGACTNDSNCCPGSYCGSGGTCTCVPDKGSCTSDTQCCSIINGGGCDNHGDAGRTCSSN